MFWSRAQLKWHAKQELKQAYPTALGVCTMVFGIYFVICFVSALALGYFAGDLYPYLFNSNYMFANSYSPTFNSNFISAFLLVDIIGIAVSIFVFAPLMIGINYYFIQAQYGKRAFSNVFYPFKSGKYLYIVGHIFLTQLFILLWSLLFLVPGIIKSYQYRMIPMLLCEDRKFTTRELFSLTKEMTRGEKGSIFVLDLSFLGWAYLSILVPGIIFGIIAAFTQSETLMSILPLFVYIGMFFLLPYIYATNAQLYFALKSKYFFLQNNPNPQGNPYGNPQIPYPPQTPYQSTYQQPTYPPQYPNSPYGAHPSNYPPPQGGFYQNNQPPQGFAPPPYPPQPPQTPPQAYQQYSPTAPNAAPENIPYPASPPIPNPTDGYDRTVTTAPSPSPDVSEKNPPDIDPWDSQSDADNKD